MKALRWVLVTGVLAGAAGCSRQTPADTAAAAPTAAPTSAYDGAATYAYLVAVGHARAPVNSDNRDRIPALIRGQDPVMLGNEATTIAQYRQELAKLPTDKVDPDAMQFARNFEAILSSYESICTDTAELFNEATHADQQKPDSLSLMQEFRGSLKVPEADAIGAAGALVDTGDRLTANSKPGDVPITAIVGKLRDDRDKLVTAKETHHAFALKVKADFAKRYPGLDWSAKEVFPP
jgi:hypothetical protein